MRNEMPSFTALTAAAARAAHLVVDDEPRIFADTLAAPLLGDRADELIGYHRLHGTHLVLAGARAQAVCRGRYTEDHLTDAVRSGMAQYVVLGAGLDTFAYRGELARRVRVFEVDQPGTQEWKRAALASAGIAVPDSVTFVPADFARDADRLGALLHAAGLDPDAPALVSWLGVTMYLTHEAIGQVLATVGRLGAGTEIIADYMLPAALRDSDGAAYVDLVAGTTADRGEPWLSFLAPDELTDLARQHGVATVRHVYQRDAVPAALWRRSDALRPKKLAVLFHGRADSRSTTAV
ncbi:MAG TPA: class I SAM-dependent methyltransferase [Trebonia sp.]